MSVIVHFVPSHLLSGLPVFDWDMSPAMMMSQNESASETTAGTNARPMNSEILKLPSLSASQNAFSQRTNLIVKSGENIA